MHSPVIRPSFNRDTLVTHISNTRALIDDLCADANETSALIARLQTRSHTLHDAITIPTNVAPLLLADFVVRYIEHVPNYIEAMHAAISQTDVSGQIEPLLKVALNYFLHPGELARSRHSVHALLPAAYLAHRLLEELNDRFIAFCGAPLISMDTTRANLVSHELIGEAFATELDQAVLFSAELLFAKCHFNSAAFKQFFRRHCVHKSSAEQAHWPCLAAGRLVFLDFSERRNRAGYKG
ncbi:hypothetical protein [Gilvimarinus polysaccharolyticus]|uniref:hypothetical protein n=1 Tax=Gilvimarinus polysaccharolyticus TaxID=863921 RepID=UPI000673A805|nr:hypothetical protein [Gilvimarinus polysaccharolyticus]